MHPIGGCDILLGRFYKGVHYIGNIPPWPASVALLPNFFPQGLIHTFPTRYPYFPNHGHSVVPRYGFVVCDRRNNRKPFAPWTFKSSWIGVGVIYVMVTIMFLHWKVSMVRGNDSPLLNFSFALGEFRQRYRTNNYCKAKNTFCSIVM